ncbi:MAG: thioredoxin domain-containing protein [Desulfococcaceae bacterium]|jgi:thioredoxin 1|nr:thioredoxin domain-containing protein [Desulfococcaceae bacterium]
MMNVNEIKTPKEFRKAIKHGITLVDFHTPWCAPCRIQEPILLHLAEEFAGKAEIACMNIDHNRETAVHLGIKGIPTLMIFRNGKEIQRFVGLQTESALSDALRQVMQ